MSLPSPCPIESDFDELPAYTIDLDEHTIDRFVEVDDWPPLDLRSFETKPGELR